MLSDGKYRAVPIEAALGMTGTGKEQIAVRFDVLDHPGEAITWYGFFTDATFDRTIESLRCCGWQGTDLAEFGGAALPEGFCREVQIVVESEAGNDGVMRPKVRWVNSGGGLAMKERLDAGTAAAFAARMRGKIVALQLNQPKPQPQPSPAVAKAAADDDEIPF